jgi:transposase
METAAKIRRWILVEGRSARSVARETGISRVTIKKYLTDEEPPAYNLSEPRENYKLKGFEETLRQWFEGDLSRVKRERRTAQRMYEQLTELGYTGSYSPVVRFIKKLKSEKTPTKAYVPLEFEAGDAMQFDWSHEWVELDGIHQKVMVAHFRLCYSRQPFVIAYFRESQEMLLDAFNQALAFFNGTPRRVLIDNAKTMICFIGRGKYREYHPRFLAQLNHYLIEPVACNPAAGWEKGQVENQVQTIRQRLFTPKLKFGSLQELNEHLYAKCIALSQSKHPEFKPQSICQSFQVEQPELRPSVKIFDGYVEKTVRAYSTCCVQYDTNRYSVPAQYAGKSLSLKIYAFQIVICHQHKVIAHHQRSFNRHDWVFEPWHYLSLLKKKPGALRDGRPFKHWDLPQPLLQIKEKYLKQIGGDKDFVQILLLCQQYDIETVSTACELALEEKAFRLPAIVNMLNRLTEDDTPYQIQAEQYPTITCLPEANCSRYDSLTGGIQ